MIWETGPLRAATTRPLPVRKEDASRMSAESRGRPDNTESREWLLHCEGFRVEGPDGFVGVVTGVVYEFSARWDRPSALAVRGDRGKALSVPLRAIADVSEDEGRVLLRERLADTG